MRPIRLVLVAGLLFLPTVSSAIQLHWKVGSTELTFTGATRCTLVVQADSAEVTLPAEWRLLWVADSAAVQFVSLDSLEACASDTSQVHQIEGPSSAADSAANLVTAHFCSAGENQPDLAQYIIDLPGDTHGKFKVVALDPEDSTAVIESNEVTFNGGVSDSFPPVLLLVMRSHASSELDVAAVGSGLGAVPSVELAAPDGSWRFPLQITEQTEFKISAVGRLAADLPPCILLANAQRGPAAIAEVDADTASSLTTLPACVDFMKEVDITGQTDIQPKDFAIVASRDSFHVFYIRHDMKISDEALNDKTIGHQRSRDLNTWLVVDKAAIQVRSGRWDSYHVWAPSIIKKNITYYMFYVGVDGSLNQGTHEQRIGVATSTDLNVWTQDTTWVYSHDDIGWAVQDPGTVDGKQLRDPFVMEAPDSATDYLMYFVTVSEDRRPRYVVGVARSKGDLRQWSNRGALWNTDVVHTGATVIESPHVWKDNAARWNLYYTGAVGFNDSAFVCFQTNEAAPFSRDTSTWSASDTLYKEVGYDDDLYFWHASEYLQTGPGCEYLLAFDDDQHAVSIAQISWRAPHTFVLYDSCPPRVTLDVAGQHLPAGPLSLTLAGARPAKGPLDFQVGVNAQAHVHLGIFDVAGRRVRTLVDERMPAGTKEVRWDLRDASGQAVGAGVYFARMATEKGQRVAKFVVLR